jgi:hypothetical protein
MSESEEDRAIPMRDVRAVADVGRAATSHERLEAAVRDRLHCEMTRALDDALRDSLALRSSTTTRFTRRRGLAVVGAGVAVGTAVVGISLLASSGTPGQPFPEAAAALARQAQNPAAIVHFTVTGDDVEGSPGATRETWATVDESTIRYRTTQPDGDYSDVLLQRRGDASRLTMYNSKTDTIYSSPWTRRTPGPSRTDQLSITGIGDYADAVKAGNAKVDGETTIAGTPVYRVTQTLPVGTQVWFVSKDAQHPKLLRIQRVCHTPAAPCPSTDFSHYSITDDRASLAFPDHPGAATKTVDPIGANGSAPAPTQK